MSEETFMILLLAVILLHGFSLWRFAKTLEKQERLFHIRWQRLASILSGRDDQTEFIGLDPKAKSIVENAEEQGFM